MHELSIALSIIDGVLEERERRGGVEVQAVYVSIGPLAGVDRDALDFAYTVAREGTDLATSRLVINDVPVVLFCPSCREERNAESAQRLCCAECGTPASDVVRGKELEITALEIAEIAA
jgi:hydrogenase nickel incorporation protein HypA/HybF